jgi:hypothetical protein
VLAASFGGWNLLRWLLVAYRLEFLVLPVVGRLLDVVFYIGWWNAGIFYVGCNLLAGCTLELGTGYLLDFLVQELGTTCRNFLFSWLELV